MARPMNRASTNLKIAKERRAVAIQRNEFRYPSVPRHAAAGATSFAIKDADPELRRLVMEYLAKREARP